MLACLSVLIVVWVVGVSSAWAQGDGCANAGLRVGPSAGLPDCRAYELVSPAYKPAGIGVGFTYEGLRDLAASGVAAYEGDRFASLGHYGSTLNDEGVAFVTNWAFGQRTGAGWVSHNPFTHALSKREVTRMPGLSAATDDLSRVVWRSQVGGVAGL